MANITLSNTCTNCGNCVQVCPSYVYEEIEQNIEVANKNRCILCGHCIASCPVDAIAINEIGANTNFNFINEPSSIENWLKTRRSIRNFTNDAMHKETLRKILKWGESAPRAHNADAFELLVIQNKMLLMHVEKNIAEALNDLMKALRDREQKQRLIEEFGESKVNTWRKMLPELRFMTGKISDGSLSLLHNAPALIIAFSDKSQIQADISAQLALHHISLGAHFYGFGCCWLGFLSIVDEFSSRIIELFDIKNTSRLAGALILGKPKIHYQKGISRNIRTRFLD